MNFRKLFGGKPTKREQCKAILQQFVAHLSPLNEGSLNDLDFSAATDEQVDMIYEGLIRLRDRYNQMLFKKQESKKP